ncbi:MULTISPECIES: DUF4279 domain-containing protein [unclassified Rhizobium]|uniref:DUF4279 domain-containing protein n=1 Tax=unclassified Rhizobium TaxID=2613769 RepID=UPI000DDDF825|nr:MULTISPECIES: DUF4279 domain-containing protein [unclassified Rhizobium]MBB3291291.1 hypothetical protein [Rhizobium sp. BK252]MBB3406046.1 hypothetical protein [Rhizobium sp. BK289]MBB3416574.1 hypothetical protein [Rhizobium sp. BK284]MBB3486510.1 hypothetical protein [Rhizobium sp. BK347]MDK4724004.1 DUF4279 domain-containing protein [Rhizobium sp. CNPSo 3968]
MTNTEKAGTVAVYIHGDNLEPERITDFLGVEPDEQWKSGDERLLSSGSSVKAKTGMWTLTVPLKEVDLDHILAKLTETLGKNFLRILSVPGIDSAYADVLLFISQRQADAGYTLRLPNSELAAVVNAGLDIQVTVSIAGD